MGVVSKSDCSGNFPLGLVCKNRACEQTTFYTDETMTNDCPDCGAVSNQAA